LPAQLFAHGSKSIFYRFRATCGVVRFTLPNVFDRRAQFARIFPVGRKVN